jgi:serine/threonine protein kinase
MALQGDHRCVRLLRSFDYRGHICLVFELLGPNLYEVMRANSFKPFSVSEIRILARQVLESLAHTHAKGVVHTDVKPENVLFEELLHKRRNSHALAQGGRLQVTPGTQVGIVTSLFVVYFFRVDSAPLWLEHLPTACRQLLLLHSERCDGNSPSLACLMRVRQQRARATSSRLFAPDVSCPHTQP